MRIKKYSAWGGVIIAALLALSSLIASLLAQVSFCSICGAREETHVFGLRFTELRIFRRKQVRATAFSALLEEKKLVSPHSHLWQKPRFVADPMDESGPRIVESFDFLNAERVVNFTRNVADYADPLSAARWRELAMHPRYARLLDGTLRFLQVPTDGFPDRAEFLAWWGRNSFSVYNRLREQTEPD